MKRLTNKKALLFLSVVLFFVPTTQTYAATTTLWSASNTTYVTTEHGGYFSDTYNGTASVRGADRSLNSSGRNVYFLWTRITYDVQGSQSSATAYSGGKNDGRQVIRTVQVKDLWNNGLKTKAYYNYSAGIVDGSLGRSAASLEEEQVFYGGGLFEDGVNIEFGN